MAPTRMERRVTVTERLPNNDETGWGDVLGAGDGSGGFLRVAHNDDGTPLYPGASYLIADTVDQTGLLDGSSHYGQFALKASAGSDISINGGDNTKIDFATTGWYDLNYRFLCGPESSGLPFDVEIAALVNGASITSAMWKADVSVPEFLTVPVVTLQEFMAGDYLQFFGQLYMNPPETDTWNYTGDNTGFLRIVRLS